MSKLSAAAFLQQIESGKRTTDAMRVFNLVSEHSYHIFVGGEKNNGGICLSQIQKALHLSHGTSTARLSELCDMGVIYEDDNGYFHITPPDKIAQYAAMREDARYKKWKKLGEKNGWFNQLKLA